MYPMGYPLMMYGRLEHHAELMASMERVARACGWLLGERPRMKVVLILDDSDKWLGCMARSLPDMDVKTYTDPAAGVQAAKQLQPALVLVDLQWGGQALGYQLAARIRSLAEVKVQLVSGFGTDDGEVWGKLDTRLLDRIREAAGVERAAESAG